MIALFTSLVCERDCERVPKRVSWSVLAPPSLVQIMKKITRDQHPLVLDLVPDKYPVYFLRADDLWSTIQGIVTYGGKFYHADLVLCMIDGAEVSVVKNRNGTCDIDSIPDA